MFIRSQDKNFLVNYSVGYLKISNDKLIYRLNPCDEQYVLLGRYEEGRLNDILDEIENSISASRNIYWMPEK